LCPGTAASAPATRADSAAASRDEQAFRPPPVRAYL
jgi:hypothetical protein